MATMQAQGIGQDSPINKLAMSIAQRAMASDDPAGVLAHYKSMPDAKLAAFLADGLVQTQLAASHNQQAIQNYNPQQPSVLDRLSQTQAQPQGVVGLPVSQQMFDPAMHQEGIAAGAGEAPAQEQGMAGGGIVAFAGKGPSAVSAAGGEPGIDLDGVIDEITRERKVAELRARADIATGRTAPTPPPTITPENDVALRRTIAQNVRGAAAAAAPAVAPAAQAAQAAQVAQNAAQTATQAAQAAQAAPASTAAPAQPAAAGGGGAGTPPPAQPAASAAQPAQPGAIRRGVSAVKGGIGSLARVAGAVGGVPLAYQAGEYIGDLLNTTEPVKRAQEYYTDVFSNLFPSDAERQVNRELDPKNQAAANAGPNSRDQRAVVAQAGVSPLVGAISNNVSMEESGKPFHTPGALGAINPGSTSYGSFQLDVSGGLPNFVKEHGATFGLTARPGTPEFNKQWKDAADKRPQEFAAAQMKAFENGYLKPTSNNLSSILPGTVDPKVLTYFTSRAVQLGTGSTARDKDVIAKLYESSEGNTADFLQRVSEYDKQQYDRHFRREGNKADTDRSKYTYDKNAKRIEQRLTNALGMNATERMTQNANNAVNTAREVVDTVRQQPLVQGIENAGQGLLNKTRESATNLMERLFPLKTGLEKPAAAPTASNAAAAPEGPTAYEQHAANQELSQRAAAQMTSNKESQKELAIMLMNLGFGTMAGKSQYALQNLGEAGKNTIEQYMKMDALKEDRATRRATQQETARKNRVDAAQKQFDALVKARAAVMRTSFADMTENDLFAKAERDVLRGMNPSVRSELGYDQDFMKKLEAVPTGTTGAKTKPLAAFDKP
jgi:hypothetical protein